MTEDQTLPPCAAFPFLMRVLALGLIAALVIYGLMALPELKSINWSFSSLFLFGSAWVCIAWIGYWLVNSRTRFQGDTLTQTWLWTKQVRTNEVAQMKLVHWPLLDAVMAPRLLVRRKGGGAVSWFYAADARVLHAFMAQVIPASMQTPPTPPAS